MNKKIKSGSEIKKEINSLFDNYKSESKLVKSIKSYLDNITGKELINKSEIERIIISKILSSDVSLKFNLKHNKNIINLFPLLKRFNLMRTSFFHGLGDLTSLIEGNSFMLFVLDVLMTCKEFEKYRGLEDETDDVFKLIFSENVAFHKLYDVVSKDKDVLNLLKNYLDEAKQKYHVNLIIQKIIPLNSIFIYFNNDKDIKGNTEDFYIMLNKKFPKSTIQTAIHDNIAKIRGGKFILQQL